MKKQLTPVRSNMGATPVNSIHCIQTKLTVGPQDDPLEKEADHTADAVMRMSQPGFIQRKCAHCEEEERQVQRKGTSFLQAKSNDTAISDATQSAIQSSRGAGHAMDAGIRSFMSQRFGHNFNNVTIHTGSDAVQMSRELNAKAFTVGSDIYFNQGEYQPASDHGKHLLAHELTHVLQQGAGGQQPVSVQRRVFDSHVMTTARILNTLGLTRQQVIDTIRTADTDAITLAQGAEDALTTELANAIAGAAVDPATELALNEELGLSFLNAAHHGLIRQQIRRFRAVRELLETGFLRFLTLGIGNVSLVGCEQGDCTDAFAFTCPANRLMVLCQPFWDEAGEQASTILHEPFHVLFHMARHAENALRRADASCFESFALRIAGSPAPASCAAHTRG